MGNAQPEWRRREALFLGTDKESLQREMTTGPSPEKEERQSAQ